jgi:hypothetical protein
MNNRPGVRKIIDNWKVVLLSMIGATTFWFFNALNKEYSAMVEYPVEFVMSRDSIVIMDPLPETITIDISGGGWGLFRNTLWFSVDPIRVQLDNPTDIRFLTRSTMMPLIKEHLSDVTVNFLYSDTLSIQIEKKISKKVKLLIDSANVNLEENHRIVSPIRIEPAEIAIIGPETIINSLQDAYYIPISRKEIDDNFQQRMTIPLPFEDIMVADPSQVEASFEVDRFDQKSIIIPIEQLNFPADSTYALSDTTVTINYIIQRSKDRKYIFSDFGVSLDYNMLDRSDSSIQPLIIYYPEEIDDLTMIPPKVQLLSE